jgi:hypothetical protein
LGILSFRAFYQRLNRAVTMSFAAPASSSSASAAGGGGAGGSGGTSSSSSRSSLNRRRSGSAAGGNAVGAALERGHEDDGANDETSPMVHTQGRQAYASSGRLSAGSSADGMRAVEPLAPSPLYCDNAVINSRYTLLSFLPMTTL